MIKKLNIQNFQSHKNTELKFSNGVNVIVGESDCGKSAILRALRFLIYNKPSGEAFRSYWGGSTKVELTLNDNNTVVREKTDHENLYRLNDQKYKAFGQSVPDEISKILNVNEINVQGQHDSSFLLSKSPGEVANHFNNIANIEIINKSLSKVKKEILDTKHINEHREQDLEEKQEQYTKYKDLDNIKEKVDYVESIYNNCSKLQKDLQLIRKSIDRLNEIKQQLIEVDDFLQLEQLVNVILLKIKTKNQKEKKLQRLLTILRSTKNINERIKKSDKIIILEPLVKGLLNQQQKLTNLKANLKHLQVLIGKYTTLTKKGQKNEEKLIKLQDNLPDLCPLCSGTGKLK